MYPNPARYSRLIFVDCETNGLPIDYDAPVGEVNNWPRIIELSWIIFEGRGTTGPSQPGFSWQEDMRAPLSSFEKYIGLSSIPYPRISKNTRIIKPDNYIISEESIAVHGITNEIANRAGVDIKDALRDFINDLEHKSCPEGDEDENQFQESYDIFLIGHNINFDIKVLEAELVRIKYEYSKIEKIILGEMDVYELVIHNDILPFIGEDDFIDYLLLEMKDEIGFITKKNNNIKSENFSRFGQVWKHVQEKIFVTFCTMKSTMKYCDIKDNHNRLKWPKLSELYFRVFKTELKRESSFHSSLEDANLTADCYFKMILRFNDYDPHSR